VTNPPVLDGLALVAGRYDAFILDVWGVLHDGMVPYPDVISTLTRLHEAGKRTILLSNAPMRAETVARRVAAIGIPRDLFGSVMTSGEEVWQQLRQRRQPGADAFYAGLGDRCLWLGPGRHAGMCEGLDLDLALAPEQADFILNTGPDGLDDDATSLLPLLRRAVDRALPMICANADLHVIHDGTRIVCAGQLAKVYERIGGTVRWHGKPFPSVYQACFALLGNPDRARILAVGDNRRTDVAGANAAGLDSLLITGGIDAELFADVLTDPHRLAAVLRDQPGPTYIAEGLRW
jgi:HAD superfamily hydrolase (TIGR01459 family)